ncbi:MAG: N-methyl-L-tryptophan oxidase, partial [Gemmataceae bacterium]
YDAIVLGMGGMGSAAAYHMAACGGRVLGLEQLPLAHRRGSSHGHTRIIRTAYYEHPAYVPLVRRSFDLWYELEQQLGRELLTPLPCLSLGQPDSELIRGVEQAATEHRLDVERLSADELKQRYPQFRMPADMTGVIEQSAGALFVEECVRAHLDAAAATGRADLRAEEPAVSWTSHPSHVEVTTARGTYTATHLVVTSGAWATALLADLGVPLRVMRQVQHWFTPTDLAAFGPDCFPVFIADTPAGAFYGLPSLAGQGLKLAGHYAAPELLSPNEVSWDVSDADSDSTVAFLQDYLPTAAGRPVRSEVCMYTLTPDRHFVIDRHPHHPRVSVACGFSGHGFKFSPVVGEILADLALTGTTNHPIGLFRAGRFPS